MPCNPSRPLLGPLRRSLMMFAALGLMGSTGCAGLPTAPRLMVPATFRAECAGPATAGVSTVGDLASWAIREEAALQTCEAKRAGLVALIDASQPRKRKWWRFRPPDS